MLSPMDDPFLHQIVEPISYVGDSDSRWVERERLIVHDINSGVAVAHEIAVYPNLNVMSAFACVVDGTRQYNVRASRELNQDRHDTGVGPISTQLLDGRITRRLSLGRSPTPIGYELTFHTQGTYREVRTTETRRVHNRVEEDECGFTGMGVGAGAVAIEGRRYEFLEEHSCGFIEHTWGVRPQVGGPQASGGRSFPVAWPSGDPGGVTAVGEGGEWGFYVRKMGPKEFHGWVRSTKTGSVRLLTGFDRQNLEFDNRTGGLKREIWRFTCTDRTTVEMEVASVAAIYSRGGGVNGLRGYYPGMDCGESRLDGDVWELSEVDAIVLADGLNLHVLRFQAGQSVGFAYAEQYFELKRLSGHLGA